MGAFVSRCNLHIGDCIAQRYLIEEVVGKGTYGVVYKVKTENQHTYALKLLHLWDVHPEIRQALTDRFDMEFKTGKIRSPYLVQSVDHGFICGNPYIVMEYCPGGDVIKLMEKSEPDLVKIGRHVLYGLKELHRHGKVHRDLKPENVLMKADGDFVLTDFGISGDRNRRMTERNLFGKPKQIFGTYAYMPPEQIKPKRGDATILPTTDIFSFGVMMYQLITSVLPFGRLDNESDLVWYLKNGREGVWDRNKLKKRRQFA
jgi:serine/threonine protein kinase